MRDSNRTGLCDFIILRDFTSICRTLHYIVRDGFCDGLCVSLSCPMRDSVPGYFRDRISHRLSFISLDSLRDNRLRDR